MDNLTIAYLLLAVAAVLLTAEVFIPCGGICFIFSAGCAIAGISLIFAFSTVTNGVIAVVITFVVVPFALWGMFYLWPHSMWGRKLIPNPDEDMTVANMPANMQLEQLRNRVGTTVSSLRPAGVVEFDGRRVDCMSEGMMIDPGQPVRCIDVRSGRVVVRLIEVPRGIDLENADFS